MPIARLVILIMLAVAGPISLDLVARQGAGQMYRSPEDRLPDLQSALDAHAKEKPPAQACRPECEDAHSRYVVAHVNLELALKEQQRAVREDLRTREAWNAAATKSAQAMDMLRNATRKTQQMLDAYDAAAQAVKAAEQAREAALGNLNRVDRSAQQAKDAYAKAWSEYHSCCRRSETAPAPACRPECEPALAALRKASAALEAIEEGLSAENAGGLDALASNASLLRQRRPGAVADAAAAQRAYDECCKRVKVATVPDPPVDVTPGGVDIQNCAYGFCGDGTPPNTFGGFNIDQKFQEIGGEAIPADDGNGYNPPLIPPQSLPGGDGMAGFMSFWFPTLHAAPTVLAQAGASGGVHFFVTSQGGSTGRNLTMQVLNFSGRAVRLEGALALEPLAANATQQATRAFMKLAGRAAPATVAMNGYCLEFFKLPPIAGQLLRVAPPGAQKQFDRFKKVMSAANRIRGAGQLHPDSTPGPYADSIKQWAIWAVEQKFDQSKFVDAFVGYTKKNVEAARRPWNGDVERQVRQAAPNRWRDIAQVLQAAAR